MIYLIQASIFCLYDSYSLHCAEADNYRPGAMSCFCVVHEPYKTLLKD